MSSGRWTLDMGVLSVTRFSTQWKPEWRAFVQDWRIGIHLGLWSACVPGLSVGSRFGFRRHAL